MTFIDEVISNTEDVKIIVVEKRGKAGGHWNDAYFFVSLQQPSGWYGVNSRVLGSGGNDLVSKAKILAYYEDVVDSLVASGRVKFYWQSEYKGDGKFMSMAEGGKEYQVNVSRRIVDGTLNAENVPGMRPPPYKVEEGVNQIPVNGLANIKASWKTYVIIGPGKTGLDAICYLLDMNVNPNKIVWIVTNEMWCLNRKVYNMENLWSGIEP